MTTFTFTRSHALYRTRWCDPFEVNTLDGEGWMLLDLPGAPCDVTQPGMRTMSQRLRKAEQCAAAGGKYGLLQAVLLSLDSQPITPAQWVREAVALEACSRVLLPAAHEVPLDARAAQEAYGLLTPAEQRLWKQLQAARTQLINSHLQSTDMTLHLEGFRPSDVYTAAVLGGVVRDASLFAHEMMRSVMWGRGWDQAVAIPKQFGLVDNPATRVSMQIAYCWVLASYHHHGKDHPETTAALAAAEKADPQAWVPKLMAGLAYPSLSLAPASVRGGFMEAMGYATHFGQLWGVSSSSGHELPSSTLKQAFTSYGAALKWLLSKRGIAIPTKQQQRDLCALRLLACGLWFAALASQRDALQEFMSVTRGNDWSLFRRELEQRGVARLLRALVVEVSCWAAVTMNLPPVSAAPRLWEGVGVNLGVQGLGRVALGVESIFRHVCGTAQGMIDHYRTALEGRPAAAAALGFLDPQELDYLHNMVPSLVLAASRGMWQRHDAARAQELCQVGRGWPLYWLRYAATHAPPEGLQHMADGVVPPSTQSIDALVEFVAQETARMPAVSTDLLVEATEAAESQGVAAGRVMITQLGDPQEQRLYGLFPGWLDQLVSQVTGREVTLVIQPAAAEDRYDVCNWLRCSVYLRDAAGQQQLFYWKQPGDADCEAAHQLPGAPGAGGSSSSSSRSHAATARSIDKAAQRRDAPPAAAAAAAGAGSSATAAVARSTGGSAAYSAEAAGANTRPAIGAGSSGGGSSGSGSIGVKPSRPCAACGELFPRLKQCARCKAVAYCSRDCQVAHWKAGHKEACQGQPVT